MYSLRLKTRGFTLIEVLISLLVLAIGVLGVATLQLSTYRQLQTSNNFAIAALLGGDMADRMMANSAQALLGAYNHSDAPNNPPNCATGACTPAQRATYDVAQWQARVTGGADVWGGAGLPAGSGAVAAVTGSTNEFEIIVRWDDDRSGSTGTTCPPADADDLDCHTVIVRL
jgi:type IV pilus assembly protein PilV